MIGDRKALGQLLAALLIGLAGVVGTLLLLSRGASASPMLNGASLSIAKSQGADYVRVGAQLVYTLTYQNTSTQTVTGVVITDTLDPNVSYVTASLTPSGGLPDAPFWSIGPLSDSVSGTIVLTTTVTGPLPNGTLLTNTATIESNEVAPALATVTATVAAPTLELTKSADPDPAPAGGPLTYTLTYSNAGDATATGVVITDTLDPNVSYAGASPAPTGGTPPVLYWNIDTLSASTGGEIAISVTVHSGLIEGTTVTNTATIASDETAPLSVTQTTVISHGEPVSIALAPATTTIAAGQSISYTLIATDALGNDWDATSPAAYAIAPGAGGVWTSNVYTAEKDGTWIVTTTYAGLADTGVLTVTNVTPTAVISASSTGDESEALTFDARPSHDPGNDIVSIEWDWTYGATFSPDASGITSTHAYADNGIYTLALRVTDDNGASDVETTPITIANVSPVVDAGPDKNVDEGIAVSFTGTFTDTTADTHDVLWGFGDGASLTGTLAPTHTYAEPGNPAVTLTITDDDGGVGSDVVAVTVHNLKPTAGAGGPYAGTAGASVTLTSTGSDPGGGPLTYTWDLDDDGQHDDGNGDVVGYTWTVSGPHTATVRVVDAQQAVATDTTGVSISPAELSAIVVSPHTSTVPAEQAQTYTVEAFDEHGNSRGEATAQTEFSIVESGHGGRWASNVYTSGNHGDWTVQAIHTGTRVTSDTASLTVLAPVLHLDKRGDPESVEAGAFLTYTLTYSNTGNQAATGVVLTDVLPPHVSYVTATLEPDGGLPDAPFWTIDTLSESVPGEIMLTVAVTSPLTNGTKLTNTAWLDADQATPVSATQRTSVTSRPVMTIIKVDSTDPITEGHGLAYTIIITNSGNENGTGVTVVEDYDPDISISSTDPPADADSQDRVWTFDTLAAGTFKRISVYAQVHAPLPVGTVLTNRVTLDSDQTDPIIATEATSVTSVSDLTICKIDNPDPVDAGEELVYFITYWNSGEVAAYNVVITETYDSRVEFVSADPAPEYGTGNVWHIGNLPKHAGGNILVTVRVDTPLPNNTVLTNRVTIDSLGTLPKSCTETTTVSSTADLAFTVTDYPDPVEPGDPLTYTLRYINAGNETATGVLVTATLDSDVSFSGATPDETSGDDVWYWYLDDIAGEGGYGEITIETTVTLPLTNGLKLDFEAQLGYAEGDPISVTAQTTVTSTPVLSLHKSDGVYTVYAGDQLTYTLTYANSGKENAYDVTITDTLPNYVDYVACYGDCHRVPPPPGGNEAVVFHIPVITPTSGQARLVVEVQDPLPAGADSVTNTARMTHPPLVVPIGVQDVDPIRTKSDLRIEAQHSSVLYSPGKTMVYTLTYGNVGQHMHTEDVVITTVMPPIIEYVDHNLGWQSSDGQTYTYAAGDLLAGYSGHTISFTVIYTNAPCLGVHAFTTTFTIAESGGTGRDAHPDDNTAEVWPGVPDLAVVAFSAEPLPPQPGEPVTFTVVLENRGTAVAQNPTPTGAGFWVDIFIAPAPSCPWERYSEKNIFAEVLPLPPGEQYTLTIPYTFTQQEIAQEIQAFYVKVDNYAEPVYGQGGRIIGWTDLWGLVPESNETNNLGGPIHPGIYRAYLPLAMKK